MVLYPFVPILYYFDFCHFCSIRYPPFSDGKASDIQTIQSSDTGRFSRLVHLAHMITKSASGYAPYRSELPHVQKNEQEHEVEDGTS